MSIRLLSFSKLSLFAATLFFAIGAAPGHAADDDEFQRIQNKWKPNEYIHVERGDVEAGKIKPGWWSAQWTLDPAQEGTVRICNRWKEGTCLHIEHGELEAGEVEDGWWSAMWWLKDVE